MASPTSFSPLSHTANGSPVVFAESPPPPTGKIDTSSPAFQLRLEQFDAACPVDGNKKRKLSNAKSCPNDFTPLAKKPKATQEENSGVNCGDAAAGVASTVATQRSRSRSRSRNRNREEAVNAWQPSPAAKACAAAGAAGESSSSGAAAVVATSETSGLRVPYCDSEMSVPGQPKSLDQEFDDLLGSGSLEAFLEKSMQVEATEHSSTDKFGQLLQQTVKATRAQELDEPEEDDKDVDPVKRLAADTGDFNMRDKVGQAWAKYLKANPKKESEYKVGTSMAQKAEQRKAWAKETYSHCKATKQHVKVFKEVDSRKGKMYTFGSLVISYGGWSWAPAIEGAKRHAIRCSLMGGKWIGVDKDFSNLVHYMKVEIEHNEIFEQSWKLFTEWHNGEGSVRVHGEEEVAAPEGEEEEAAPGTGTPPRVAVAGKGKSKPKAHAKAHPKAPAKDKADKEATDPLQETIAAATKVKSELLKVKQKASQLIEQCQKDPSYDDLNNDQNLGKLQRLYNIMIGGLTVFDDEFCLQDLKVLRDKYTQAKLKYNLQLFAKIDPKPVKDWTAKMLKRHAA